MAAGLDEHACRALTNLAWSFNDVVRLDLARDTAERALALRRRPRPVGLRDLLSAPLGPHQPLVRRLGRRRRPRRRGLGVRRPHHPPRPEPAGLGPRQPAARRRGPRPAARGGLGDRPRHRGAPAPQARSRPPAPSTPGWRATLDSVDAVTAETFELALERGAAGATSASSPSGGRAPACWPSRPSPAWTPYALEIAGDHRGAAAEWAALGAPYERALALIGADDPEALLEALEVARRARRGARRRPGARRACASSAPRASPAARGPPPAPTRRACRPARARGARPRRRGHLEPRDRGEAGALGAHRGAPRRLGPSQARGRRRARQPAARAARDRWATAREVGVAAAKDRGAAPMCGAPVPS